MIIVTYDIMEDKKRTRFSKFLQQYGERIQYSVFTIRNSKRILDIILKEIDYRFRKEFHKCDSIIIFRVCNGCKNDIIRYGSPKHQENGLVFFD